MRFFLAQTPFEQMEKGVWDHVAARPMLWGFLLVAVVLLVLVVILVRHLSSPAVRTARARKVTFRKLAGSHRLTSVERKILIQVVHHYRIADPIQLFVKRSLFEGALSSTGVELGAAEALRKKLYT